MQIMKIFVSGTSLIKRGFLSLSSVLCKSIKMSSESTVFVRQFEKEDTIKITFLYKYGNFPVQNFTFMRSKSEMLEAAIARMKTKIQSTVLQKSSRKRKSPNVIDEVLPAIDIVLIKNGAKVNENTKNINAWTSETEMVINNESYKVSVNPPTVSQLCLPKSILSGFPVYPRVTFEFCTRDSSTFKWYRNIPKKKKVNITAQNESLLDVQSDDNASIIANDENVFQIKNDFWKFIAEGFLYVTQKSDTGCKLRVSCIPQFGDKSGKEESAVSGNSVLPGPEKCPFEDRHNFTKEITKSGSIRFVSYNILADLYADTDTARNDLFPYCPTEYLTLDYRRQLYLKEIIGYNADILCLQEVDRSVFHNDLIPFLSSVGLMGVFNEKGGQVAEGLSCFYRASKFKLIESHSAILGEVVKTEEVLQGLFLKICENEKLSEKFLNRTTALQVTLLESVDVPKKRVLVGNTHLYFHPRSDNIRLLQASCCFLYLEYLLQKYQKQDPSYSVSVILSGDFNSCPENGVYKLATEKFLPSCMDDWKSNPEEIVEGIDLSHSLQLSSACGTPEYTNFTQGFVGCLDYIFYDKSTLEVAEVVPFPSHDQVTEYIALPNKVFPSDHIALVSTLNWK